MYKGSLGLLRQWRCSAVMRSTPVAYVNKRELCRNAPREQRERKGNSLKDRWRSMRDTERLTPPVAKSAQQYLALKSVTDEKSMSSGHEFDENEVTEKRRNALKKALKSIEITVDVEAHIPKSLRDNAKSHEFMVGKELISDIESLLQSLTFKKRYRDERDGVNEYQTSSTTEINDMNDSVKPGHWRYRSKTKDRSKAMSQVEFHNSEGYGHHFLGQRLLSVCSTLYMREHFPHMCDKDEIIRQITGSTAIRSALSALGIRSAAACTPSAERTELAEFARAVYDVLLDHTFREGGLLHAYRLCQATLFPTFSTSQARRSQGLIWALQRLALKMPTVNSSPEVQWKLPNEAKTVISDALGRRRNVSFRELTLDDTALLESMSEAKRKQLMDELSVEPVHRCALFIDDIMVDDGLGLSESSATAAAARNFLAQVYSWPPGTSPVTSIVDARAIEQGKVI